METSAAWRRLELWAWPPTQLAEGEARAGGGGEAGAGGEGGVTGRLLQPAGGVRAQPIAALLVATQLLLGRPVSTKTKENTTMNFKRKCGHTKRGEFFFFQHQDDLFWI